MSDDRKLYRYHDGAGEVYADPLSIQRRLLRALDGDVAGAFEMSRKKLTPTGEHDAAGQPVLAERISDMLRRLDGEEKLARAAQKAFELVPFDRATGQGLGDADCLRVLYAWCEWLEGNVRPVEKTPT